MIVVTGGAGFIGSRLVKALNAQGHTDIIVVDILKDGKKFLNLCHKKIADYYDAEDFEKLLYTNDPLLKDIEVVFHQGACSDTTEWDGQYMMRNNYAFSKKILEACLMHSIPLIYASSAAVYGNSINFEVDLKNESPLNVYGYSKWQFDQLVRRYLPTIDSTVVGLRYFNVYGPGEAHKGKMASVAWHLHNQLLAGQKIKLFGEYGGYKAGEQQRDFIYVDDVVAVNIWLWKHGHKGILNVGTGVAQTFNDVAKSVLKFHQRGELEYVPFPDHLRGHYQSYTQADIRDLRKIGYTHPFYTVEQGVQAYLEEIA